MDTAKYSHDKEDVKEQEINKVLFQAERHCPELIETYWRYCKAHPMDARARYNRQKHFWDKVPYDSPRTFDKSHMVGPKLACQVVVPALLAQDHVNGTLAAPLDIFFGEHGVSGLNRVRNYEAAAAASSSS